MRIKQAPNADAKRNLQASKQMFVDKVNELCEQSSDHFRHLETLHYEQLYHFLDFAIDEVMEDQRFSRSSKIYEDDIDKHARAAERTRRFVVCAQCGHLNEQRKRVCVNCKSKGLKKHQIRYPIRLRAHTFQLLR